MKREQFDRDLLEIVNLAADHEDIKERCLKFLDNIKAYKDEEVRKERMKFAEVLIRDYVDILENCNTVEDLVELKEAIKDFRTLYEETLNVNC